MTRRLSQFLRNLRIRSKLLGGYTLIFILAILVGGAVIYHRVRATIESNIESELTNATATIRNMVETAASTSIKNHLRAVAEKNREIVRRIHGDFIAGLYTEAEAKAICRKILFSQTIGKTGYIFCASSDGIAIEHPNPGVAGKNFLDRQFVRDMLRMKTGYLEYDWKNPEDETFKPKAMYMAYFQPWDWIIAVSSYREEFRELIKISDFRDSILSLKFGNSGYAYINDSKGNLIVHPFMTGNFYDARDNEGRFFVRDIIETKNGRAVYSWQNPDEPGPRDKLVIFNYIPEYDWIIGSTTYLDEIYAPLNTVRNVIGSIVLVICILVFATSLWINASVIRPLRALMNRFDQGASGDFNIRMPVRSRDEIGQLAGYFNRFMDKLADYSRDLNAEIAHHQKTEQALRKSEEKYRTILEGMQEGYFETDTAGRFTFCNRSMENILGIGESGLTGKSVDMFLDPENRATLNEIFTDLKRTGTARQVTDLIMNRTDDQPCYVETSLSLRRHRDGRPKGFSGVVRDVTQRKKSEIALRLSEEMFSKAFRSSPSGMFIAALDDGRIINVNDSFCAVTGSSLFDLIGKNLLDIRFFRSRKDGRRLLESVRSRTPLRAREIVFQTAGGQKRSGLISAERVNLWGESCMLAALADITESRRLEREILNVGDRERQKIAMDLHDDLCPQLIGIEVMTKMLRRRLAEKTTDRSGAAENAGRIRGLILDAIEKTRQISRGLSPVNLQDRGFDASLDDLARHVRDVFHVDCRLDCDPGHPFEDNAIATHAYYIVHEAVHNSVKHAGGDRIRITLTNRPETVTIRVDDNGTGMAPNPSDSGMGIRIMRYRAGRIGGALSLDTNPDGGTRVELVLEKGKPDETD